MIRKVLILGKTWEIRVEDQSAEDLDLFGLTEINKYRITLYRMPHLRYPKRGSMESTLFHECIHAAIASSGMDHLLGHKKEEALVTALEEALYPLIRRGVFNVGEQ